MTTLTIDELEVGVGNLVERIENALSASLEDVQFAMSVNFIEIYANEQDSSGMSWAPHSPETIRRHGVHDLLFLTGAMYSELTLESGTGHYEKVSEKEIEWGTSMFYAAWNNDGTSRIPAREFMYWTANSVDRVEEIFIDHLQKMIYQI